jgi:hypothetical protein
VPKSSLTSPNADTPTRRYVSPAIQGWRSLCLLDGSGGPKLRLEVFFPTELQGMTYSQH